MRLALIKIKILLLFLFLFQDQSLIGRENAQFQQVRYYVAAENISICEDGILNSGGESLILVNLSFGF